MRVAALALLLCAACERGAPLPDTMQLVGVDPEPGETLLLNEEFTLVFDSPLQPATVNRHTLQLLGEDGREIAGEWRLVDEQALEFSPAPILARDLSDGGFRPGETIQLVLSGYPSPSALRSKDGRWLGSSLRLRYRVVERDAEGFLFYDATPSRTYPLDWSLTDPGLPLGRPLEPGEPLVLHCLEPIDPTSLDDGTFAVLDLLRAKETSEEFWLPVRLELLQNFDDEQVNSAVEWRSALAFHLQSREGGHLEPGDYQLKAVATAGSRAPTDFRGGTTARKLRNGLTFRVGQEDHREEVTLDFVDDQDALPLYVEGSDGTAHWGADGRVRVRFPAAAGDGSRGRLELSGTPLVEPDLHTTRLTLPAGVTQELPEEGLVVLRAQGRIELAGRLVRRAGRSAPKMFESSLGASTERQTLSAFLAQAELEQPAWTVIVAGGDLVLDGVLEVDTPTLLVAGGRVRGVGHTALDGDAQRQFWLLGEGGFDATLDPPGRVAPWRARGLDMDAPGSNPLREPLLFSVVSSPLPRNELPGRWREHESIGGGAEGEWRVSFAPSELGAGDSVARAALEPQPWGLLPGRCRLVVELLLAPQELAPPPPGPVPAWDPPFVDRVRLAWSPY